MRPEYVKSIQIKPLFVFTFSGIGFQCLTCFIFTLLYRVLLTMALVIIIHWERGRREVGKLGLCIHKDREKEEKTKSHLGPKLETDRMTRILV